MKVTMDLGEDILFNLFLDWKKKDIDKYNKSALITKYLEQSGISLHELSRRTGVNYSTLQDWVSMRQHNKAAERKNQELDYLLDRVTFLLSKDFAVTDKTKKLLYALKSEIERLQI
jgi:transcriptional regulator with XRE-family HTH domain